MTTTERLVIADEYTRIPKQAVTGQPNPEQVALTLEVPDKATSHGWGDMSWLK